MAFPASLHTIYTLVDNTDDVIASHPNVLSAEVRYLEDKLGIDSSLVATSIDYFLKHASGAYRTHQHDATSDDGAKLDWDNCWSDAVHNHSSSAEGGSIEDFKTGDWILSILTTARTGWTNVSSTYSNKFMRINATPLTTGGADTHVHTSGTIVMSGATAASNSDGNVGYGSVSGGGVPYTNHTHNYGTLTATITNVASGDNVPAYVQVVVFQKD